MESIPVCGVDMRKAVVAPFDAPSRRSDIAVGITPHEHSGSGMLKIMAFITERTVLPPKYLLYRLLGINACIRPANKKPSSTYGDIWFMRSSISFIFFFVLCNLCREYNAKILHTTSIFSFAGIKMQKQLHLQCIRNQPLL